jgi:predicted AAA+ superfamily ATPase
MLVDYLGQYFWLGGMPQVLSAWIKEKDPLLCQKIQDHIIETYRQDFAKYAKKRQTENVTLVFNAIPLQLGHKFKFSHVSQDHRTYQIRNALDLLIKAGVAMPCYHSSGQAQPLGGQTDPKKFKVFFLDMGLCQRMLGLDLRDWMTSPLLLGNKGGLAEQFVVQEFAKYSASWRAPELYYWHREDPHGNAEVDLLAIKEGQIIPVEIKSGTKGNVKSLLEFLKTHINSPHGLKIANKGFFRHESFDEIPLYGIEGWMKH